MILTLMQAIANIYYVTWFIWPFAFVLCLAHGIKTLLQSKRVCNIWLVIASIALFFILTGLQYPLLAA